MKEMKENRIKPAGEWNHYEIRVQGDKITLSVNGAAVSLTTTTNAKGLTITTVYDLNNRAVQEIHPQVTITTLVNGAAVTSDVTPTTSIAYDAVGNIVQITSARGFKTTRWYDAGNNVIDASQDEDR